MLHTQSSFELASCAPDCSAEHALACGSFLACGERHGRRAKFSTFLTPKRAPLCGVTMRGSRSHCTVCSQRAVETLYIAGFSPLPSRVLVELGQEIENVTRFSSLSVSPAHAATITSSWWNALSSMGSMYPCCFCPMLLALHARLEGCQIQRGLGQQRVKEVVGAGPVQTGRDQKSVSVMS